MTLEEARSLAQQGVKVRHEFFADYEYMTMKGNTIVFEDGVEIFFNDWIKEKPYLLKGWSKFETHEKTAVEQFKESIEKHLTENQKLHLEVIYNHTLGMEKQQMINFHIEVMKRGLAERWSDNYLPKVKEMAEKYFNELFNSTPDGKIK
jgi:hypothetical protein